MILVTGGTGLVGSHLMFQLLQKDEKVRAIYRRKHKLEIVKKVFGYYSEDPMSLFNLIDWVAADLNDIPALTTAFSDVDFVYHCAAFVSFEPDKYHLLRKINIEGTANIVNLSIANNVKKICYVSSVAAIGHNLIKDQPITEETDWNQEYDNSVYAITKYGAELEVWRGSQEGLEVIVVNPGVIIGPGLWHGGGSSGIFKKVHKGLQHYTNGSSGYIDVKDVVRIMIKLMSGSIVNKRYILITDNLSFKEFLIFIAKSLNIKPPSKMATSTTLSLAWRLDWFKHKIFGKRRRMSKQMAKSLQSKTIYDNSKIIAELDYDFIPIKQSIVDTAQLYLHDLDN